MYRNPNNKSKNEKLLKEKMIGAPFSDIQQEFIYKEVKQNWLKDKEMALKNNQYVEMVLLPEVFLKIYQKFLLLDSTKEAEAKIFHRESCDPADITPETSDILV